MRTDCRRCSGSEIYSEIEPAVYTGGWYDPYLNRWAQPDTIVPLATQGVQAWDRYAYLNNNPVNGTDPSGHGKESTDCGPDGMYCNVHVPRPSKSCSGDCWDTYMTFRAVVKKLGYIPDLIEILYMTADTEYTAYTDKEGVRAFGQEAIARNFYARCGINCKGDGLYNFLQAYEPWMDWVGTNNNQKTPDERADNLIKTLDSNKKWLWNDMSAITDAENAVQNGWILGKQNDKPWQWWGGSGTNFRPDPTRVDQANFGCSDNTCAAQIRIQVGDGEEFWMLTGVQNDNFKGNWK